MHILLVFDDILKVDIFIELLDFFLDLKYKFIHKVGQMED